MLTLLDRAFDNSLRLWLKDKWSVIRERLRSSWVRPEKTPWSLLSDLKRSQQTPPPCGSVAFLLSRHGIFPRVIDN